MFRIGLKFPVNAHNINRFKTQGCERLSFTVKCYQTKPKIHLNDCLLKDVILETRLSRHRYSTHHRAKEGTSGTLVTFGVVTIGVLGVLTYAKSDNDFRDTLEKWIPGTDGVIKVLFQEESSYISMILNVCQSIKESVLDFIFNDPSRQSAPRPAFESDPEPMLAIENILPEAEIRLSKEGGEKIEVVKGPAESPPPEEDSLNQELIELEKYGGELASKAIAAFKEAACAVQDYNKDVMKVVESSDATVDLKVWERLKVAQEKRVKALEEAEKTADEAVQTLKKLQTSINDPKLEATQGQRTIAKRNINNILTDVDAAKKKFDGEVAHADLSDKYWKSVQKARERFHNELQILFPNINLQDKKMSVSEDAFDLFVLHMYHKVSFLQKELEKMQTITDGKIKHALRSDDEKEKLHEAVNLELSKERTKIQEEFDLKLLTEKKELDDERRRQLQVQAQVHSDHLREALAIKDREAERRVNRALNEAQEEESLITKTQLASVIGRLRGLDEALKTRLDAEKDASEAQLLWGACQALVRAVKSGPPGTSPDKSVRPLEPEVTAIINAAPKNDDFVNAAVEGIPKEAVSRGVFPEDALRERFIKVEKMARKLALVPEEGASLPIYLLSYLQSFLLVKAVSPIPQHELDDEPVDVDAFNTYEVLQRARYWLDRGDFKMTLRYMNLLKGAPRNVARDWMNEARILLETQQAIESLVAYAGASSLVFMGGGDPKSKK